MGRSNGINQFLSSDQNESGDQGEGLPHDLKPLKKCRLEKILSHLLKALNSSSDQRLLHLNVSIRSSDLEIFIDRELQGSALRFLLSPLLDDLIYFTKGDESISQGELKERVTLLLETLHHLKGTVLFRSPCEPQSSKPHPHRKTFESLRMTGACLSAPMKRGTR